jgi:hypothetical protein
MRRPELAIIELGSSAGLLLVIDRYAIRYHHGRSERTYGEGSLTIGCAPRGDGRPGHAATAVPVAPAVAGRHRTRHDRCRCVHSREAQLPVMNEPSPLHPWSDPIPHPEGELTTNVTVVAWRGGTATVEVLAEGDPHGRWLRYDPRGYGYTPPALSGASDV